MYPRTVITLCFCLCCAWVQAQTWNWAVANGTSEHFVDGAALSTGETVVISTLDDGRVLLHKYSSKGILTDSADFGGVYTENEAFVIGVNAKDHVFVAMDRNSGRFAEEDVIDEGLYIYEFDTSLVRLDGICLIRGGSYREITDMVIDAEGSMIVAGGTGDKPFTWNGKQMKPGRGGCDFVAKISNKLKPLWIQRFDHIETCCGGVVGSCNLAVTRSGYIVFSGTFNDKVIVSGKDTLVERDKRPYRQEVYVAGITKDGVVHWSTAMNGGAADYALCTLSNDHVILALSVDDTINYAFQDIYTNGKYRSALLDIDPKSGLLNNYVMADTAWTFTDLVPDNEGGCYLLARVGESSSSFDICYLDTNWNITYRDVMFVNEPAMFGCKGKLMIVGGFAGTASFGPKEKAEYLSGRFNACVAEWEDKK